MAEADWAELTGTNLDSGSVARGVTNAFTRPNGGGGFAFGYHSLGSDTGVAGYYVDLSNFNPVTGTKKGGSIRCAMKRYSAGVAYAPVMGFILGTDPTTSNGYLMGLSEASSYQIALRKGAPATGMDATGSDILRASTSSFTTVGDAAAAWKHLRMDVLVNPHGEVVIDMMENDLDTNLVSAPVWAAIDGMDLYIDDALGILTGSLPHLTGFYAFFGHYTSNLAGAVSLFDQIEVHRQTAP